MSQSEMSELSETDISQSSREDSGIHTSFGGSGGSEENLNQEEASCSDALAELFQSHKRLREVETQVRSLSLILEHGNDDSTGIDQAVFQENKSSLEQEIMKIKQEICDKEFVLQQRDMKLFEYYLGSIKDETNSKLPKLDLSQNEEIIHSNIDNSELTSLEDLESKNTSWENEDHYFESSFDKEHEIAKLRRALAETKQKHKQERDNITKQLKALQITTVQGETNWRCVLKEKQLKIDELTRKNSELQTQHAEVTSSFKISKKLRQKEGKESEKRKKKDEKIILSLRTQNEEMKQLLSEESKNIKQESNESLKQLTEKNEELQKNLCDKSQTLDEKSRIIEEYSKEIKETNILVNQLVMEVNCLNTDNENLNKQIEEFKTENTKNLEQISTNTLDEKQLKFQNSEALDDTCSVHVGIQTDECSTYEDELQRVKEELELKQGEILHLVEQLQKQASFLESLKENEIKLEKESERWKNKSLQNERTIQDLTISLGKATAANELSCERKIEKHEEIHVKTKGKFADSLIGMLREIKEELNGAEEDAIKHKEKVSSLEETWRKYKISIAEMNESRLAKIS